MSYGRWVIAVVVAAAAITSEVFVIRQNAQLKRRAAESVRAQSARADRAQYEASLVGRCQPFYEKSGVVPPRPLHVSIYFSLDRDCLSCVHALIGHWNEMLSTHPPLTVTGYTEVDGTQDERILAEELKPAFSIVRVDHIDAKLRAMGVTETPVVFVADAATGRILFTHAPLASEKGDRSFVDRLRLLLTPCS